MLSCHNEHLSMTAQGQTYLAAAGDQGAPELSSYDYPDNEPEVLIVGGTSVNANSAGVRQAEVVWNDSLGQGSGGWAVTSDTFNVLPTYQKGNGVPTNIPYRLSPDVALMADLHRRNLQLRLRVFRRNEWRIANTRRIHRRCRTADYCKRRVCHNDSEIWSNPRPALLLQRQHRRFL